ncbi:sugar porter family MFS transporter [Maribacter sp.]|uniref:Major facilitator superfamily (MFS) profile domain-containing protein n=1 Tax=marine sediment metagenome TaxID=412755 RepID=A0A0F9VPN8_9ZZZZ|nr:sugar porter family MFS transporter [Maribacter sp.]HDZ05389.1 MFS transporter [Maribacter sp.]HEA81444.1 MFS transporter [Maribacter sp.]|tara:strand:- start:1133 stop:2473 length:1341 start_codon:yes stop_codon:yes gene_type:complete
MNRIIIWSITVALAGFLFGFDTVVISGANEPIKQLWDTSPLFHGTFIMSMALWGTVVGSLFGGIPTNNWGRKKTLLWVGILFLVSALGSALAQDPYSFSAFRFIGGVGVGISSVAAPIYISEITSKENRGKLGGLYQFWLVFGILLAFVSNWLLKGFDGANDWRWMLGVEAIPAFIYTLMVFTVPESPRWLALHKKDDAAALKILEIIHPKEGAAKQLEEIKTDLKHTSKSESLFQKKYSRVLWLGFFIAFFNQLSGINFVLYYAPEILEQAGLGGKESLFNSIAIGIVNLVFTFIGIRLLDKLGRRQLIIVGSIGYIISLIMVGLCFQMDLGSTLTIIFICTFVASHAIGQGAVIWVFISEIYPNSVRAYGQSWGVSVHWVFAAIITLITPFFLDANQGVLKDHVWYIYYFFCAMMVLQLIWAITKMPETKGVSLEELSKELVKE